MLIKKKKKLKYTTEPNETPCILYMHILHINESKGKVKVKSEVNFNELTERFSIKT